MFKIFLTTIALALCTVCLYAQNNKKAVENFDAKNFSKISKSIKNLTADPKILRIENSDTQQVWNTLIATKQGILKPDTNYTAFLNVNITDKAKENSYLHIIVRPLSRQDEALDVGRINVYDLDERNIRLNFRTKKGIDDYSFQIISHFGLSANITNFSILEGDSEIFHPLKTTGKKYTLAEEILPKGAKEFDIDLPNNPNGIVVKASDFGATQDADDFVESMNKAINHCKNVGAAKLVLEKGTYRISKNKSINFTGLENFEFDGGGSTFIYLKTGAPNMTITNCQKTKIGNFNFDWDYDKDPLASIVEVVKFDSESASPYVDFKFIHYEKFPKEDVRMAIISAYDAQTKSVGIEGGFNMDFEFFKGTNVPKTEWVAPNILRVFMKAQRAKKFSNGQLFRAQHYYYDMHGIIMNSNKHLTLENINIYACAGHALVVNGTQQYWHFKNVNIAIPENDERRVVTCTADHFHIANSKGFFKMENCRFSRGSDDCINIHDCSGYAKKNSDSTLISQNLKHIANYSVSDEIELRNGDFSPSGYTGKLSDIITLDKANGVHKLVFKDKIPDPKFGGFILFNKKFDSRNIIIRNCLFDNNRARGILILGRDITIENCKFIHNEMGAIKIETGYTLDRWSEGYGVDNVLIRNNYFESVNPAGIKNFDRTRDIYMGVYMRQDPSYEQTSYPILKNILFEKNTFKNSYGLIASINSTENVIFSENVFINDKPRKEPLDYRACFYLNSSSKTKIVNNTWVKSDNVSKIGVYVDKYSVKDVIFEGNKLVDKAK